jgi:hypothetical protein
MNRGEMRPGRTDDEAEKKMRMNEKIVMPWLKIPFFGDRTTGAERLVWMFGNGVQSELTRLGL